jgi:hypothetical protein
MPLRSFFAFTCLFVPPDFRGGDPQVADLAAVLE